MVTGQTLIHENRTQFASNSINSFEVRQHFYNPRHVIKTPFRREVILPDSSVEKQSRKKIIMLIMSVPINNELSVLHFTVRFRAQVAAKILQLIQF